MLLDTNNEPSLSELLTKCDQQKIAALPLEFQHIPVQILSKQFTKLNSKHPYRIHYLGPRPINSYVLHKKYSDNSQEEGYDGIITHPRYQLNLRKIVNSSFINEKLQNNHYYRSAMFYRAFEGMNPSLNLKEEYVFNSAFESGNLDCVIKVQPKEFDLFLRIDSNTRGHTSWYYFSIKNTNKLGKITLNICNLSKNTQLYENGMRPYVFSRAQYNRSGVKWQQMSGVCSFAATEVRYEIVNERKSLMNPIRLSFEHEFEAEGDEAYFAYAVPYTYSQLWSDLHALPRNLVSVEVLGKSLTGVDIPVFAVRGEASTRKKKNIVVTGRVHPGETNGSYLLKGFIDYLCGHSKEVVELRRRVNVFVVPMLNPDGVIMGNSRTSAVGKDLNREFHTKHRELYPEVTALKALVSKLQRNYGVFMYLDFHGHSRKKNTFMYGPAYALGDSQYYRCRVLPRLIEKANSKFRFYSCSFNISEEKKTTARAVMLQQFRIPYSYTIESSVGLFYDAESGKTVQFTQEEWVAMGVSICTGVAQFVAAYEDYENIVKERKQERIKARERMHLRKNKKFAEDELFQEKHNLFEDYLKDVKEATAQIKINEIQASSDEHDAKEDLEAFKLAEFNNLIIQNTQKEAVYSKKVKEEQDVDNMVVQQQLLEEQISEQCFAKQKPSIRKYIPAVEKKKCKVEEVKSLGGRTPTPLLADFFLGPAYREIPKKNFVLQNKQRYNIATKNLFPLQEKCQIVQLPKTIKNIRRELRKGRQLINSLWEKKNKNANIEHRNKYANIEVKTRNANMEGFHLLLKKQDQQHTQNHECVNFKFLNESKMVPLRSVNSFMRSDGIRTSNSFRKIKKSNSQATKVRDAEAYDALSNVEVDNLAMTIRTYQRHL